MAQPVDEYDLAELIERRRQEHGESYGDIAKRAGISKPYVYKLATQPVTAIPRPRTIAALARGLGTTERVIRQAALVSTHMQTANVEVPDPRLEGIVASLDELSDRDLRVVEQMIETLRRDENL